MNSWYLGYILLGLMAFSCTDEKEDSIVTSTGNLDLVIEHTVDDLPLQFDSLMYYTKFGEQYNITRLNYYLSNFILYRNHTIVYQQKTPFYINAKAQYPIVRLSNVPVGTYDQIGFSIGLSAEQNMHGKLPSIDEHLGMIWPTLMGGGYHFLKLEGQFVVNGQPPKGYALHTGLNFCRVVHQPVKMPLTIQSTSDTTVTLTMNINSWFYSPTTYSLVQHGNYTMGDTVLMRLLTENGKDVFTR